jgi:hypothetical protein
VARDAAGNDAEATTTFEIDTEGPQIVITTPEDGTVFAVRTVGIGGFTEPGAAVAVTLLGADGLAVASWNTTADEAGNW